MTCRIEVIGQVVYYKIWYQIPYNDYITGRVSDTILQDCSAAGISQENIRNYIWVIDCGPEGISEHELTECYNWMLVQGVAPGNFRVVFSCKESLDHLLYPAITILDRMVTHGELLNNQKKVRWRSMPMDYQFVCLMRRGSVDRAEFGKLLLDSFDRSCMLMTLGIDHSDHNGEQANILYPHPYPVYASKYTELPPINYEINPSTNLFYKAPINLVVETSSQLDVNTWKKIFITEKTFKSIVWHQFPLWYAVPGLVQEVRNLGFDVFDDIFDNHQYDTVQDIYSRRQVVVDLLDRVLTTQDVPSLRLQHWSRLKHNIRLYLKLNIEALQGKHHLLIQQLSQEKYV